MTFKLRLVSSLRRLPLSLIAVGGSRQCQTVPNKLSVSATWRHFPTHLSPCSVTYCVGCMYVCLLHVGNGAVIMFLCICICLG